MTTVIRPAAGDAEHAALYAFRYRVYVEEMGRVQKHADHAARRIRDPLDATGHNLVALDGPRIVGCVRLNFAADGGLDYYRHLLRMDALAPGYPRQVSLSTRLMVAPGRRGSALALRLCLACYDHGRRHGIRWNFIDCNDHLVEFFRRLGYVPTHRARHEEYGDVNVMRLDLQDRAHLEACNSPFLRGIGNGATIAAETPLSPARGACARHRPTPSAPGSRARSRGPCGRQTTPPTAR